MTFISPLTRRGYDLVRRILYCRRRQGASKRNASRMSTGEPHRAEETQDVTTAAYLHIPFCRSRCYYCDFPLQVVGDGAVEQQNIPTSVAQRFTMYTDVLIAEIDATSQYLPNVGQPLKTIYFGGGTPSLLPTKELERILNVLEQRFGIANDVELTIEMDPGTFDLAKAKQFVALGMNRASVGAQSFDDDLLRLCGRRHSVADIYQAMEMLRMAQVTSISLDLISGLPTQTMAQWEQSLRNLIALEPTHASCYDLVVEDGTRFGRIYKPGESPLPTSDEAAEMYRLAVHLLNESGLRHYEVSNYARGTAYQSRHNRTYWENRPYFGFGMGATSYLSKRRISRPKKMLPYVAWVEDLIQSQGGSLQDRSCDMAEELEDFLMLGLRLTEGVSLQHLTSRFGPDVVSRVVHALKEFEGMALVEISQSRVRIKDPEGFLVQNTILSSLLDKVIWSNSTKL